MGEQVQQRVRRGPDLVTLMIGVLALVVSGSALLDVLPGVGEFDARWLLAAGAALLGVVLLAGALRGRGGR